MHFLAILTEPLLAPTFRNLHKRARAIMIKPQIRISFTSFRGAMSSIMCSRMNGRRSSSAVPTNFTNSTSSIAQMCFFMYDQMNFMGIIMTQTITLSNMNGTTFYCILFFSK